MVRDAPTGHHHSTLKPILARVGGVRIPERDNIEVEQTEEDNADSLLKRLEHMLDVRSRGVDSSIGSNAGANENGHATGDLATLLQSSDPESTVPPDFDSQLELDRRLLKAAPTPTLVARSEAKCTGDHCFTTLSSNALPIGLGVGIPIGIAVCLLVFLHFRHLRILKREEIADRDIDVDGDDTEHYGMRSEKFAPRLDYATSTRRGSLETIRTIRSNITNSSYNYSNEAYPSLYSPSNRSNSEGGYQHSLHALAGGSSAYPSNASVFSRSQSPSPFANPAPRPGMSRMQTSSQSSLRHEAHISTNLPSFPPSAVTSNTSNNGTSSISSGAIPNHETADGQMQTIVESSHTSNESIGQNFATRAHRGSESSDVQSDRVFSGASTSAGDATPGTSPDTSSIDSMNKLGKRLTLAEPELAVVRDRESNAKQNSHLSNMPHSSTMNDNLDRVSHMPRFSIASSAEMLSDSEIEDDEDFKSEASFDISARKSTVELATTASIRDDQQDKRDSSTDSEKETSNTNGVSLGRSDTKHFDRVRSIYREYMPEDDDDEQAYQDQNDQQSYFGDVNQQGVHGYDPVYTNPQYYQEQGHGYSQDQASSYYHNDQGSYYPNDQGSYYAPGPYGYDSHYAGSVAASAVSKEPSKAVTPIMDLQALPSPSNLGQGTDAVLFAQRKRLKAGAAKPDDMLPAFNPLNNWDGANGSALPSPSGLRQSVAMIDSIEFAPPKKFNGGSSSPLSPDSRSTSSANNSMMSGMSSVRQMAARPYSKLVPDAKSNDEWLKPTMDMSR